MNKSKSKKKQIKGNIFIPQSAVKFRKMFHERYDYMIKNFSKRLPNAVFDSRFHKCLESCINADTVNPYEIDFYNDYFISYNVDSIIDYAYTLPKAQLEMCIRLLYSAIQYYRDMDYPKTLNDESGHVYEMELADVYFEIRKSNIWYNSLVVIDSLKEYYAERILTASFPMQGPLVSRREMSYLKKKFVDFNPKKEKQRFINLVRMAIRELQNSTDDSHIEDIEEVKGAEDIKDIETSAMSINLNGNNETLEKNKLDSDDIHIQKPKSSSISNSSMPGSLFVHDKTNIGVLDNPVTESAMEVEFSLLPKAEKKVNKEKVIRQKGEIDYTEQQMISQKIGEKGEELVLRNEVKKLKEWGLSDNVVAQVRRVSLESDDYGFDILSFDKSGKEHYIEVKTTKLNKKDFSFILTQNELEHAKHYGQSYSIVMVFDVLNHPYIWYMGNPFIENPCKVGIKPIQYRIDVSVE